MLTGLVISFHFLLKTGFDLFPMFKFMDSVCNSSTNIQSKTDFILLRLRKLSNMQKIYNLQSILPSPGKSQPSDNTDKDFATPDKDFGIPDKDFGTPDKHFEFSDTFDLLTSTPNVDIADPGQVKETERFNEDEFKFVDDEEEEEQDEVEDEAGIPEVTVETPEGLVNTPDSEEQVLGKPIEPGHRKTCFLFMRNHSRYVLKEYIEV